VKHTWLLIAVTALAGCGSTQPPASSSAATAPTVAASSASVASGMAHYDGYGELRFGMDEQAFRHAWQGELAGTPATDGGCYYLRPKWAASPADFGLMFEQGRFVRYDVGSAKETAPGGGKVGMSVAQIRVLYGNGLAQMPHKYLDGAYYLRIVGDGQHIVLFETDAAGKITRWRVGVPPQIDYVEGCG
jgi:hypothetical protein